MKLRILTVLFVIAFLNVLRKFGAEISKKIVGSFKVNLKNNTSRKKRLSSAVGNNLFCYLDLAIRYSALLVFFFCFFCLFVCLKD